MRSWVTEMQVTESRIMLALEVSGRGADPIERWQVLVVRQGFVIEISGFDDLASATDWARRTDRGAM